MSFPFLLFFIHIFLLPFQTLSFFTYSNLQLFLSLFWLVDQNFQSLFTSQIQNLLPQFLYELLCTLSHFSLTTVKANTLYVNLECLFSFIFACWIEISSSFAVGIISCPFHFRFCLFSNYSQSLHPLSQPAVFVFFTLCLLDQN